MVRSCTVGFCQSRAPTKRKKYRSVWQSLQRSVQRLTLLLPVEEQEENLEVTDGVVSRVQPGGVGHAKSGETSQEICPGRLENDVSPSQQIEGANKEDSDVESETVINLILSPTAAPFHPRIREVIKERFLGNVKEMDEVNSLTAHTENLSKVPSAEDASGLGSTVGDQAEMGTDNKISLTDRELRKGRSEVELTCSSSNEKKRVVLPSNDEGQPENKAKCGQPRKGSRVPTRRSERTRLWREGRKEASL